MATAGRTEKNEVISSLHDLSYILQRLADKTLLPRLGVSYAQYRVLDALVDYPAAEQRQLAARLGQTEAAVSRALKSLRSAGLVKVTPDSRDNRRRIVSLTPNGQVTANRGDDVIKKLYGRVFRSLSPAETVALERLLGKLRHSLPS